MPLHRLIVILLVVLAVASAPLGAALAGPLLVKHVPTHQKTDMPAPPDMSGMPGMADCEKMMSKSGSADCPCCDPGNSCPPEACIAKCFKIFGDLPPPPLWRLFAAQHYDAAEQERTLKRSIRPQTPPPRT